MSQLSYVRDMSCNAASIVYYDAGVQVKDGAVRLVDPYEGINHDFDWTIHEMIPVLVSIFSDASGTVFALDNNGQNIDNKTIKSTNYTYTYFDTRSNLQVDGHMIIGFSDGSTFDIYDIPAQGYWYSMVNAETTAVKPLIMNII